MQINLITYLFAALLVPVGYNLPICNITSLHAMDITNVSQGNGLQKIKKPVLN